MTKKFFYCNKGYTLQIKLDKIIYHKYFWQNIVVKTNYHFKKFSKLHILFLILNKILKIYNLNLLSYEFFKTFN